MRNVTCDIMNIECQRLCLYVAINIVAGKTALVLAINVIGEQCGGSFAAWMIWSTEAKSESKSSLAPLVLLFTLKSSIEAAEVREPVTSTGMCCLIAGSTLIGIDDARHDMHAHCPMCNDAIWCSKTVTTTSDALATHKALIEHTVFL